MNFGIHLKNIYDNYFIRIQSKVSEVNTPKISVISLAPFNYRQLLNLPQISPSSQGIIP